MAIDGKAPYYICVKTNGCAGNWERELVAYSTGVLDYENRDEAGDYIRAFWNAFCGNGRIRSMEEYREKRKDDEKFSSMMRRTAQILDGETKEDQEKKGGNILDLYDKYLSYDRSRGEFYHIGGCPESGVQADCLYIHLMRPLDDYLEGILVKRIVGFFEGNVQQAFDDYRYIMMFGERQHRDGKPDVLEEINLMDADGNVLKNMYGRDSK